MRIKIRQTQGIPGYGGLNFMTLREDGWTPDMELEGQRLPNGLIKVTWTHKGRGMARALRDGEYEVIEQ